MKHCQRLSNMTTADGNNLVINRDGSQYVISIIITKDDTNTNQSINQLV